MSQNPPKTQAQIDAENAERDRILNSPDRSSASPSQAHDAAENERRQQEAARERGPAVQTGLAQAEIDARARNAATRAPEFGHAAPSRTQEQINAENDERRHLAANPNNPRASDFVHNQAKTAEPRPDSPIPGDRFHERDPAVPKGSKTGPLPGNFPGRLQLKVAGFPTYETARTANLNAIAGIDGATAKLIEAALKE